MSNKILNIIYKVSYALVKKFIMPGSGVQNNFFGFNSQKS